MGGRMKEEGERIGEEETDRDRDRETDTDTDTDTETEPNRTHNFMLFCSRRSRTNHIARRK